MSYLIHTMLRSRDTYEEYIMNMEQNQEKELVRLAQREQALNRELYKLGMELEEKQREIERLNSILGIFKETAEKLFLSTKRD